MVTFMFLLAYCTEDLLELFCFNSSQQYCLFPTNHGPSWSSYLLIFTVIIVILKPLNGKAKTGIFPESYSSILKNGHQWKRSCIPNHSQWENKRVHTFWGTQRPSDTLKSDNNYHMKFLQIIMPNSLSADLHSSGLEIIGTWCVDLLAAVTVKVIHLKY